MRPTLSEILHPSQYCGAPRNTIFHAVVAHRDATAYAETMRNLSALSPWIFK
jgi:hypothetical protein